MGLKKFEGYATARKYLDNIVKYTKFCNTPDGILIKWFLFCRYKTTYNTKSRKTAVLNGILLLLFLNYSLYNNFLFHTNYKI